MKASKQVVRLVNVDSSDEREQLRQAHAQLERMRTATRRVVKTLQAVWDSLEEDEPVPHGKVVGLAMMIEAELRDGAK